MAVERDPRDEKPSRFNGSTIGVVLLVVAFCVSLFYAIRNTIQVERPSKTTVRICHWQLEGGYRNALQAVIDEYEKLHPDVEIEQVPITEKLYGQWLNTQLVSGAGPDLCEMGMSKLASQEEYTVRYFLPLSPYITDPNPYNQGNDLADVPWRETLLDGMKGGFREGLQEYYGVPTTLVSMRLFYNKKLLRTATGSDAPPQTFGEWMEICRKIREKCDSSVLPIVSTYYVVGIQGRYEPVYTSSYEKAIDLDLDGTMSVLESYIGFMKGQVSFDDPRIKALFGTVHAITDQMQQDFSAMDRQQAQFRFANGQAGFMWTGSWDAAGTVDQARARGFEVGICDLPIPVDGEPFAQYVRGRSNDAGAAGGGVFGVSRNSKHIDVALDFLKFFTARKGNELFAKVSSWPALTVGVPRSELMQAFTPNPRGYNSRINFNLGSRMTQDLAGVLLNYYQGEIDYDTLSRTFTALLNDRNRGGLYGWWYEVQQRQKDVRNKERVLAQQAMLNLIRPDQADNQRYVRTLFQQVTRNNGADFVYLYQQQFGKELPQF